MRISTNWIFNRSVNTMQEQQKNISDTQIQISTGKKFNSPADDPSNTSRIMALQQYEQRNSFYSNNINTAINKLQISESKISSAQDHIDRIHELTVYSSNGGLSVSDHKNIATEIEEHMQQLTSLVNTKIDQEYIFSGGNNFKPAVVKLHDGSYEYNGDHAHRSAIIGDGSKVDINVTGHELFFDINSQTPNITTSNALVSTSKNAQMLPTSELEAITTNSLTINNVTIQNSTQDLVSGANSDRSSIAIVNAINNQYEEHGVIAQISDLDFNIGALTSGTLNPGDLIINGHEIVGNATDVNSILSMINSKTDLTGVSATESSGEIVLSTVDGRNITIDSLTNSSVTFSNLDLTANTSQTIRAGISLQSTKDLELKGTIVNDLGFTPGKLNSSNTSTTSVSAHTLTGVIEDGPIEYVIQFDSDSTYSVYDLKDLSTPIEGYSNLELNNRKLTVNNIELELSNMPVAGEKLAVSIQPKKKTDIFSVINDLISALKLHSGDSQKLAHHLKTAQRDLLSTKDSMTNVITKIGANLNYIDSQEQSNKQFNVYLQESIGKLVDLDYSEAITRLSKQTLALEAAQNTFIKIQNLSIFKFLR